MPTYELFGDKYDEKPNPRNAPDEAEYEPCAYCGKAVRIDGFHFRVEFDGQGWYAIGSECRKKFPEAQAWENHSPKSEWAELDEAPDDPTPLEPGIGLPYHDTHAEKYAGR